MGFIGDFFSTLFHGGKTQSERTAEQNAQSHSEDIQGYGSVNGETVQVVNDKTAGEWLASGIINLPNTISTFWNDVIWDPLTTKQSVDEQLIGLKYDGQGATDDQKNTYVQMLGEYQKLNDKKQLTITEAVTKQWLDNELNKYTVPDTMQSNSWDHGRFGYDSPLSRLFGNDHIRNNSALEDETAKWVPVDRNKILDLMEDSNGRTWSHFGASDPKGRDKQSGMRVMTNDEYQIELKRNDINTEINNLIDQRVKEAVQSGFVAPGNPGGRNSTEDEVRGLFESMMSDRAIASNLDSYREVYAQLKDKAPEIANEFKKMSVDLVDMGMSILMSDKDTNEAYQEYLETHDNPLEFDVDRLDYDKLNTYEKTLLYTNLATLGQEIGDYSPAGMSIAFDGDGAHMANTLLRWSMAGENIAKGNILGGAWNALEWAGATIGSGFSSALGNIAGLSTIATNAIKTGELKQSDFDAALFGWQSSSMYNLKQNYQQEWANPDYFGSDIAYVIKQYGSIADDIGEARGVTKLLDFPVVIADLKNINKVLVEGKKLEKAVEGAKAVSEGAKVAKVGTEIVKDGEKLTKSIEAGTFFGRVKEGVKSFFTKSPEVKMGEKYVQMAGKDMAMIGGKNIARWIADEAVTSAVFQGMTPYTYTEQDLSMDIFGAVFSGLLRVKAYNNRMGMFKYNAIDSVWTEWYLSEVMGYSRSQTIEAMEKLDARTIKNLGNNIKQKFSNILDKDTYMSRADVKSKSKVLGDGVREATDKMVLDTIDKAEQNLMKLLADSIDPKYTRLVKRLRTKNADGSYSTKYEWNKPKGMKQSTFDNLKKQARVEAYSPKGLNDMKTIKGKSNMLNRLKAHVHNHLAELVSRGSKERKEKYLTKDKNGKWVFKRNVSDRVKKALEQEYFKKAADKMGLGIHPILKKGAGKDTWFGFGVQDYTTQNMGPIQQRFALYINSQILGKKLSKRGILHGLSVYGAAMERCFRRWLKETYNVGDVEELTEKEMIAAMMEFGKTVDEFIFPDFVRRGEMSNIADPLGNDKQFLANMTYDEAIKLNPDLKYMSPEEFHLIAGDPNLSIVQKELKLRGYERIDTVNGKQIYGLTPGSKMGEITFHDTMEEKAMMGDTGEVYIQIDDDGGANVIAKNRDKYPSQIKPIDKRSAKKYTYKLEDADKNNPGVRKYSIHDDNGLLIGYIETTPNYHLADPNASPSLQDLYGSNRTMKITLMQGDLKGKSVELEFERSMRGEGSAFIVQKYDQNMKLPDTKRKVTGRYFDTKMGEVPETSLQQWNGLTIWIRDGGKNYNDFCKMIPGYTDRVPQSYFDIIMSDKNLSIGDKMNMLIGAMFNKNITETGEGIRFNVVGGKTFNRRAYKYTTFRRSKEGKWEYRVIMVSGDNEVYYNALSDGGAVLVRSDPNGKAEAFYYKPGRNPMQFELYRSPDDKKPCGVISFAENRITGYFRNKGGRKQILGDVEFLHDSSIDFVSDAISKRYDATDGVIRVDGGDEMYKEIYKELYGVEMPESEYLKLKNTPNMTPEKYLNQIVDEFKQSRFGRYATFKKGDWRSQVAQMNRYKVVTGYADNYVKRYPESKLTDAMIYKAAERYVNESIKNNGIIKLSKAEIEIRDIMYGKNARAYDPNSMINIYGYSMFGVEPPANVFRSEVLTRLRNRREAILLALYKDKSIKNWTDYEQSAFLSRMKRKLGKDIYKWTDVSLEDLIEDIKAHPDEYQAIASKFWERVKKIEDEKAAKDADDLAELSKLEKRKKELEEEVGGPKPKKVKGPDTDKISHLNYEGQRQFFEDRIITLEEERLQLLESGDVSPEAQARLADLNRQIDEANDSLDLLDENISYLESKKLGEMTQEEYEFLADRQVRGEGVYEAGRLNPQQVQERVNQIKKNIPGCRILEYDPVTGRLDTRSLTKEERKIFASTLERSTNALANGEASAAHLPQLHAIVMNPNNVSIFDLGHEWFHESCALMMDQSRRYEVFEEAYTKFKSQIEEFAVRRGYADQFKDLDELTYQRRITEEWLAERFGEYVQGRLELENSVILKFFRELWEKIKLMFTDTQVMDLFDDIYEGRLQYNEIKVDLKPEDINSPNWRLTKDSTVDYVNQPGFIFGDNMNLQELLDAVGYDDAVILTDRGFTGKGNFFSTKKQVLTLEDGRQVYTNYDELYEGIMKRDKEIGVDNAIKFLFGSDGDFYNWISNKGNATYKSLIVGDGAMMVEVHYPDNWDGTTIADFKIMIPKGAEGAKTFTIEGVTNTTISDLSQLLGKQQYNAIIKALQTYSLNAESLKFAEIDPASYAQHIKAMGPNYDRFINQYMPDVLEQSVDDYVHGVKDASFNDYENIDQIEEILNRAYRTLMFDRCIPHTNGSRNGIKVDIYNGLYNRKWARTKQLIQDVIDLGDPHLKFQIGRSRGKCPAIQFIFTDRLGKERRIGWHMTDEQVLDGKNMGWWKYSNIDEMMDTPNMHAPGWQKSMLIDPEGTVYKKEGVVGVPLKEQVRNLQGVKNPISFRVPPTQAGQPGRIYRFDGLAIQTDRGKGFVTQKNMTLGGLEGALKNHGGVSSSVALSEDFIPGYDAKFGPIALLGRKLGTEWNRVPFEGYQFFSGDTWTPILHDVVTADFQLAIRDIVDKYADRLDSYIKLPKSIKNEINNVIKSYGLDIKKGTNDDQYRTLINRSRNNDYSEKTELLSNIKAKLGRTDVKDKVVVDLLKNKEKLGRIFEEIFQGRIAGMNEGGLRKALALNEVDQYMLGIRAGRNDLIGNGQWPQVGGFNEMLEEGYIYNQATGLLDFEKTFENVKDWPILRAQYEALNIASEEAYKRYIKELIIMSDLYHSSNRYFEGYSRLLNLNDFHSIVTSEDNIANVKALLDKYHYKYHFIENIEGMTHEDFEKLIDEYANEKDSFLLIQDGRMEVLSDVDEEGQALFYDEVFTNTRAERAAENEFALINRRTRSQVSDETMKVLNEYGLTGPVIGISEQKYVDNMRQINDVLRRNNYNMKINAPELYEQKQVLKKNRIVNDKQTWANSKRRILNQEYRDVNRKIRDIERRMEIRQEEFDDFKESPMYYQANKLREALAESSEARDAVRRAYENSDTMVPEKTQSYKPQEGVYTKNRETTSITPPLAKNIHRDNYYQITEGNPVSDFLYNGDESLMTSKNPYRAEEMNIIGGEVQVCFPVGPTTLGDPYILDAMASTDSFAIWATDTDTLNKMKAKIESELGGFKNIYDRVDGNIAYYVEDTEFKASDEVNFRRTKSKAQEQLAKQIEEDKNITEASLGSTLDSSLICKL